MIEVRSFQVIRGPRSLIGHKKSIMKVSLSDEKIIDESVIIELVLTRPLSIKDSKTNIIAYDAVYKESKEDVFETVIDSPLLNVIGILFNPLTLVLALYFSSVAWSNVVWFQQILKLFGRGKLVENKSNKDKTPSVEDLPFQTFECQKCGMELRPARGRAEKILGRERFRCSKCGAKASAYFDIDDLNDPRAIARLERIATEKEDEDNAPDVSDEDDDVNEDDEEEEEEEEEQKPPPKRRRD